MGILKRLFSVFGAGSVDKQDESLQPKIEPINYNEYLIYVAPRLENGQYRVAGRIEKVSEDNVVRQHEFIRSDLCMDLAQAEQITLQKCKVFIDQAGDDIFT